MIPEFNDDGYLPAGVHLASLEEVAARFGQETELRRVQMESLRWLVNLAQRARAIRLIVNGSFVTDRPEPNDVDCVLLVDHDFPRDADAANGLVGGLPFIELKVAQPADFAWFVERVFASDRDRISKGMIEIPL